MPRKEFQSTDKFKSPIGAFLTQALFYETNRFVGREGCLYTLKDKEHEGYPSLKELYFFLDDPTEYKVATELFGGWDHWRRLTELAWFKPYVEAWRSEMAVKRASEALESVIGTVRSKGKDSLGAAKYLLGNGWLASDRKSTRARAGRPPKEKVKDYSGFDEDQVKIDADRVLN